MSDHGSTLWHVTMSLDGFIADADDGLDWAFGHGRPGPVAGEVIKRTGAILAGRRGYDLGTRPGTKPRGIYGGAWDGPVYVLTHRPGDGSALPRINFLSNGIEDAVATTREAAGGKSVGIFGASIARQCLQHGLLDEIIVHVAPVLIGHGIRLLDAPSLAPVQLERIGLWGAGQITDLRFSVRR